MTDQLKVNESTELNIPLKTLISVIVVLISGSWYVFETQEKIHMLELSVKMLEQDLEAYKQSPSRSHVDIELIKKDIEYIKAHKH